MIDLSSRQQLPDMLTILHTYQCTASCDHCCFNSSPDVKGRIPQENILKHINEASQIGIKNVTFSGGEAFLLGRDLDEAVSFATSLHLGTRVVTNGYWAITRSYSRQRMKELRNAGLKEISFSTGDHHQKFVPLQRIIQGIEASLLEDFRVALMIEKRADGVFDKQVFIADHRVREMLDPLPNIGNLAVVESPWMPFDGKSHVENAKEYLLNKANLNQRPRCSSVLNTLVVDPDEQLGACCGLTRASTPELMLGSLKERTMKELFSEALEDFIKIWLFVEGPERILAWAAEKDPSIEWENKYSHQCHSCRELYSDSRVAKVIREHHNERTQDILMRFWMLTELEVKA